MERERQAKWDAAHLRTATTKLTAQDYELFRATCYAQGKTPYAVLQQLVTEWMERERYTPCCGSW